MDGNNWRTAQAQGQAQAGDAASPAPVPANGVVVTGDWRAQLQQEYRLRIVNQIQCFLFYFLNCYCNNVHVSEILSILGEIPLEGREGCKTALTNLVLDIDKHIDISFSLETLKRHLPFSGPEGLRELRKIAVRFEEKIYATALDQSDYQRKISLKMLSMEPKSPTPMAYSLQSNNTTTTQNSQGQPLSIPMVANQSQTRQQLVSQNIQNTMTSSGLQSSGNMVPVPTASNLSQPSVANVVNQSSGLQNIQNSVANTMGQGMGSNMVANSQRQVQGRQQQQQQQQQQQPQTSQQILYQKHFHNQMMKRSLMQSHMQQQQNLLQQNQIQSSQQAVMQQSQQPSVQQSTQSVLQQQRSQSVLRQQQNQQAIGDWRAQLQQESRQLIVNLIMESLKRHLPFSGPEGHHELRKIAVRFEEKIYATAVNQSEYLRKVSLKMSYLEPKSPTPPMAYSLQSNNTTTTQNPKLPESLDSTAPTGNANGADWQEEAYQKIKSMKDMYFMDLNDLQGKISGKLDQWESLGEQPPIDHVNKLKNYENMVERLLQILQLNKSDIQLQHKEKMDAIEKQIHYFLKKTHTGINE